MTTQIPTLIDELEDALTSGTIDKRIATLWRITDLFVASAARYTDAQVGLFDDLILRLAAEIEGKARAALSRRLAPIPNAPPNVIRHLAFDDEVAVARPVLLRSERLADADLAAAARSKSQGHLLAISQRRQVAESVTDVLVARGDRKVAHALARNAGARISEASFARLVARARTDDLLAEHVGLRRDIPWHHVVALLAKASESVRSKLLVAHPRAADAVNAVVSEITGDIRQTARSASRPHSAARAQVEALWRSGHLGEADVYAFATARRFEETAIALSLMCELSCDLVENALLDEGNDTIMVVAKVACLSWTSTRSVLMLHAGDGGIPAADLDQAFARYARLQIETARRVVEFYRLRQRIAAETLAVPTAAAETELFLAAMSPPTSH